MNTDKVFVHGIEYVPKLLIPPISGELEVGRWKPKEGEQYWLLVESGKVYDFFWRDSYDWLHMAYAMGNVYQTEELALRARDKQLLLVELQDYADQCNAGKEISDRYYYLANHNDTHNWAWDWTIVENTIPGTVQFRDKEDAEFALAHFGSRLDLLLIK